MLHDLMPPAFADGLDDWSWGDGTPDSPSYDRAPFARLVRSDPDFGVCLEMRKVEPVQRLRYMGEMPLRRGGFLEISARLKGVRGPLPAVRVAAWPGGMRGREVTGVPVAAAEHVLPRPDRVLAVRTVIGFVDVPGVDLVWDERVLYAHVGLDLVGIDGGVVRVEDLRVEEVSDRFARVPLPGFAEPERSFRR
jgi:hypothetical protein